MKKKGFFITLEGTEGTGKTTQIDLLVGYLRKKGRTVIQTREPGGTTFGANIRGLLLNGKEPLSHVTETLLFMASRAELVRRVIEPALRQGKTVVCDRWLDATVAYQGYGLGVPVSWIQSVAREVTKGFEPDITFFLDLAVSTGLERAAKRSVPDRVESRGLAFHRRVRSGYLAVAKGRARVRRIPVTSIEATHRKILETLEHVL